MGKSASRYYGSFVMLSAIINVQELRNVMVAAVCLRSSLQSGKHTGGLCFRSDDITFDKYPTHLHILSVKHTCNP